MRIPKELLDIRMLGEMQAFALRDSHPFSVQAIVLGGGAKEKGYIRRGDSPNDLDLKVFDFFKQKDMNSGCYIECGANNGFSQSNTLLLEQLGWTGILIEADPRLSEESKKYRPDNIIYNAALVGPSYTEKTIEGMFAKYYGYTARELQEKAKNMTADERKAFFGSIYEACLTGKIASAEDISETEDFIKIEVPAETLFSVLQTYGKKPWGIDFFSLDVEGLEYEVLSGLNLEYYRPKYILTEVSGRTAKNKIDLLMHNSKYKEVANFDNHDIMYEAQ